MYVRLAAFVLTFAFALAPTLATAQGVAQGAGPAGNRWALLVGIEDGPGDSGLQIRGDMVFPQRRLSPVVGFAIVGSLGFSRFSDDGGSLLNGVDTRWDNSLNLFRGSGSARFTFGTSQTIHPYADAGLGIYYAGFSASEVVPVMAPTYPYTVTYEKQSISDSDIGLYMRFAGGIAFQVSPTFDLGVEIGFQPYFGDYPDDTLTSLLASATFRM